MSAHQWRWDETLYAGSAGRYRAGRLPYPDAVAGALQQALDLDGRGRLLDVGCGPGSLTLLLAPLFAGTTAVHRRFPDHPPYRGAHADLVPHLTVGHDAPVPLLRAAAATVAPHLPIRVRVSSVRLIEGSAAVRSWHSVAELPLGPASGTTRRADRSAGWHGRSGSAAPGG